MHLSLAIGSVLFFGSYVAAIPVWPQDQGSAPSDLRLPWEHPGDGTSNSQSSNIANPGYPPPHPLLGGLLGPPSVYQSQSHTTTQNMPRPGYPPPHPQLGGLLGPPSVYQTNAAPPNPPMPPPQRHTNPRLRDPVAVHPAELASSSSQGQVQEGRGSNGGPLRVPRTRASRTSRTPYARPGHSGADTLGVPDASGSTASGSRGGGRDANRRFRCSVKGCGATATREPDIIRHEKSHSGETHVCSTCNKGYSRKDALQRHQRTSKHTGDSS